MTTLRRQGSTRLGGGGGSGGGGISAAFDGDALDAGGHGGENDQRDGPQATGGQASPLGRHQPLQQQRPLDPVPSSSSTSPIVDRSVETRTSSRITLTLALSGGDSVSGSSSDGAGDAQVDRRGWRSPHGEPYRPLGNPELNLKFTPRLVNGAPAVTTSHRMRVFDGIVPNAKDGQTRQPTLSTTHDVGGSTRSPARATLGGAVSPTATWQAIQDMFPRNLHRRSSKDRLVKLAHRLEESMSQRSPDKIRGLRRPNPVSYSPWDHQLAGSLTSPLGESTSPSPGVHASPPTSPRVHVHHGDTSQLALREAIESGSMRLRLAKNGAGLLEPPETSNDVDLSDLQRAYEHDRERFLADQEAKKSTAIRQHKVTSHDDESSLVDDHAHATAKPSEDDDDDLYLPYTTRLPQPSPHKKLPTFSEFKTKAREERLPMRSFAVTRSPNRESTVGVRNDDRRSTRTSRVGSMIMSPPSPRRPTDAYGAGMTSPGRRISPRRGSVLINTIRGLGMEAVDGSENTSDVAVECLPPPPRPHGVVRLQSAVDAIEDIRQTQATLLTRMLQSLDDDRQDCLVMKYKHFDVHQHMDTDIAQMRETSETQRYLQAEENTVKYRWFPEMLRQMVARECPLHPAENFIVHAIRRISNEGHALEAKQLFRLILMLHAEDLSVPEVQQTLTFLRRALFIAVPEWEAFYRQHHLPEPIETFKQREAKKERKNHRIAKMRTVLTINQVLRRMATPQSREEEG